MLKQPDLARTLERIADQGPAGFYEGETAALIEKEMKANGGLITRDDLKKYQAKKRAPSRAPTAATRSSACRRPAPAASPCIQMLNILEGYDLKANGFGSAQNLHLIAESMRRAFADRAHLGDPDFVTNMPVARLISKEYAAAAQDDQPRPGVEVVADLVHLADRVAGDHAPLGGRCGSATPCRSPTRSNTATARASSCRAPGSC
jgi:gamma-glutamyltranspeptidase